MPPKQRRDALEILRSVQGPTLAQPGCTACQIYQQDDPDHAVLFLEGWASEDAFKEHIRSEGYRRILAAVELSDQPPEVCFHQVSATHGMELIQQIRGGGGDATPAGSVGSTLHP
jgi:quinol monooxygenase YgiN